MEQEIEEELQEIYKNLIIEVEYKDIRKYEIITKIEYQNSIYESKIQYTYDVKLTLQANTRIIEHIIDTNIIIPFFKNKEG